MFDAIQSTFIHINSFEFHKNPVSSARQVFTLSLFIFDAAEIHLCHLKWFVWIHMAAKWLDSYERAKVLCLEGVFAYCLNINVLLVDDIVLQAGGGPQYVQMIQDAGDI